MQDVQKILWNDRLLTIAMPIGYDEENPKPFTTVFVQDGDDLFSEHIKNNPKNNMFVGLEPVERNREYTPWEADVEQAHYAGEAEQYLDLLEFELIPFLKENYHIFDEAEYLAIGGGSFGALVSLYALLTRPHIFGHYILISASMWYPNFVEFINSSNEIEYPRHVYWYVGEQEGAEYTNILKNMVPDTYEAVELLKEKLAHPESSLTFVTQPDGIHRQEYFEKYFDKAVNDLF